MNKANGPYVSYFAQTDFRGRQTKFGIKENDRTRHVYIVGKTGMGKSTLLENMAIQDIQSGQGMAFVDPHGKSAEFLLDFIPADRQKDVIYFAPFDLDHPISFNVLEDVGKDKRHLVAGGLMSTFKKIWEDSWSARMEYILNNTLLALLEYPGATLLGVNRMFSDKAFRLKVVENVTDPSVKSFWEDEFGNYTDRFAQEATPAIQNKVGQFTSNPVIRNIIGQSKSSIDFRRVMDERKILIVNLSKGRLGEDNARLIGGMLMTKLYLAGMSRAAASDSELKKLPFFYLFADEFQSLVNESFADILSEARKYKLSLTIAHQYIEQMPENVRDAVFGNVGTTISFRVGPFDAEVLEKIFLPSFTKEDLVNLGFAQIYLTLMIDGVGSPPFSAVTIPPIGNGGLEKRMASKEEIIAYSQQNFARPREEVEKEISDWYGERPDQSSKPLKKSPVKFIPPGNSNRGEGDYRRENYRTSSSNGVNQSDRLKPSFQKPDQSKQKPRLPQLTVKSVSLGTLKPNIGEKSTGKHKGELRSALSKILGRAPNFDEGKKENAGPKSPAPIVSEPPKTEKPKEEPKESIAPVKQKEIPEDVLKKLLQVDDE